MHRNLRVAHEPDAATPWKRTALAAACLLALSAGAHAQSGAYEVDYPSTQALYLGGYTLSLTERQSGTGALSGAITAGGALSDLAGSGGSATPVTLSGNAFEALGAGNRSTSLVDLALLSGTGLGTMTGQVMAGVVTTSKVQDTVISATQTGMGPAAITINGNTLVATTTLNRAATSVSGATPTSFSSNTTGAIAVTQGTATLESGNPATPTAGTTASVNLGTYQSGYNAGVRTGSGALADNADVTLTLSGTTNASGTGTPVLSSPLTLGSNTVAADYTGNTATTAYSAGAGSGAFAGSVAVTNAQSNVETAGATTGSTAAVTSSQISADVRNASTGRTDLTGALTLSGNALRADSTGNAAGTRGKAGGVLAGNAIVIDGAPSITGSGSATSVALATSNSNGGGTTTAARADLAVASAQFNGSTVFRSTVTSAEVTARADNLAGGTVTLGGNAIDASSTGNLAGNLVYANTTSLSGSAAASSVQNTIGTPVSATNTDGTLRAGVGASGVTSTGQVTLAGNAITADARTNLASSGVTLSATELNAVAASGAAATAQGSNYSASGRAGVTVANLQTKVGSSTTSATVTNGTVSADFTEGGLSGGARTAVGATAATLADNRISASAAGNTGIASANLSATNATLQAAVVNSQNVLDGVSASVSGSGAGITVGDVSASSALTIARNTVGATGAANVATNALTGEFTNLTPGVNAVAAGSATANNDAATVDTALGVANRQGGNASVTASVLTTAGFATLRAGLTEAVGVEDARLAVQGNEAIASAEQNVATNALRVSAIAIGTTGDVATQVAAVSNSQAATGSTTATVGAASAPTVPLAGIQLAGRVSDVDATVGGNTFAATAAANTARNTLDVTGALFSPAGTPSAAGTATATSTNVASVTNAFGVVSRQVDVFAGFTANANNVVVGIDAPGDFNGVAGSKFAVTGNAITASARNNDVGSTLRLNGFSVLSTGAGVVSSQTSVLSSGTSATVSGAVVRIEDPETVVSGSDLAVSTNRVRAAAVGNAASNALLVQSTVLSGNAAPSGTTAEAVADGAATVNADFGVASRQEKGTATSASASASQLVSLKTSTLNGGSATVSGNATEAVAQANSVGNALTLAGTEVGGVSAGIASAQQASASVSATQTASTDAATFAVHVANTSGNVSTVSGNTALASAGMNEAFNTLDVSGTVVDGRAGTSFAVVNAQSGSSSATATARPGFVGARFETVTNGSATVADNTITARSSVNTAGNALNLGADSTLSAGARVENGQSAGATSTATVGDTSGATTTTVGVAQSVSPYGIALNGTSVTVSGNGLNAQAGGNAASNALNATAVAGIGAGTAPTFAVLNTQSSTGAMTAQLAYANVGAYGAGSSGSATNTNVTVQGNQASATAYANTASNTVATSVLPGSLNAASTSLGNTQSSTGAVSATATNVNFGSTVSSVASGGAIVMSGNGTLAQASGNTAVNRVVGR